MAQLKKSERCPIHGRRDCCGRQARAERFEQKREHRPMRRSIGNKWELVSPGVYRMKDVHAPNGYRERRSRSAMRKLLIKKVEEQNGLCGICGKALTDMENVVPDHIAPKGYGGSWRDDSPSNIQAAHHVPCNAEKGSIRGYTP